MIIDILFSVVVTLGAAVFIRRHTYFNASVTLFIIFLFNTSFWQPLKWWDKKDAEPFIGEYVEGTCDTTYIYYATFNAESILKRNEYIYNNSYNRKKIKCISLDKFESLYQDEKERSDIKDVVFEKMPFDSTFNWKFTIYEYNENILRNCY